MAEAGPLDDSQRARLQLLRARAVFQLTRSSEVLDMLLGAAQALAPLDAALSRQTYLKAPAQGFAVLSPAAPHTYLHVGSSVTITDAKPSPGAAGWTRPDLPPTTRELITHAH